MLVKIVDVVEDGRCNETDVVEEKRMMSERWMAMFAWKQHKERNGENQGGGASGTWRRLWGGVVLPNQMVQSLALPNK